MGKKGNGLYCLLIAFVAGTIPVFAATDSLAPSMDKYFSVLNRDFTECSVSKTVKSKKIKPIYTYFVKTLKKHQPLFSLLIADAKGKVLCEAVRGEKTLQSKKDVSKQIWYLQVRKSLKDYEGLVKEDNGRYYLYWSVPVLRKAVKKTMNFDGVVVAKIDLWDCFHKIAEATKEPFYIRLNDITLYTHLWENQKIFIEEALTVPGAEKISVRHQKPGVSAVQASTGPENAPALTRKDTSQKIPASIQGAGKSADSAKPAVGKASKTNSSIVIGLIVLIIIITVILLVQLIAKIRHLALMRSIDNQDRL